MTKSSLREALARKQRRTTSYDVLVDDPTGPEEQVREALTAVRIAVVQHGEESSEATDAHLALEAARRSVAACWQRITFHNLPAHEFEALIDAHPPSEGEKAKRAQWSMSFQAALIAACAVDSDLEEKEWADFLDSDAWSVADRNAIFSAALQANVEARAPHYPKG